MIFPETGAYEKALDKERFDMRVDRTAGRITEKAADGRESLENYIEKVLKTRSGRYAAYSRDFGLSYAAGAAELQTAVKEALLKDERILGVNVTELRREADGVHMRIGIKSIYGGLEVNTVTEVTE